MEAHDEPTAEASGAHEAHTARVTEAGREADTRRRARNFLQAMEDIVEGQPRRTTREEASRRRGKEPVAEGT